MKEIHRDLDLILYAFIEACPAPTDTDIASWQARYPGFSREIQEHAAAAQHGLEANREARDDQDRAEAEIVGARMAQRFLSDLRYPQPESTRTDVAKDDGKAPSPPKRTLSRRPLGKPFER